MHRVEPNRVKALQALADVIRTAEVTGEYFAPVVAPANHALVVGEICVSNKRPGCATLLFRFLLLFSPFFVQAVRQSASWPILAELVRHRFVNETAQNGSLGAVTINAPCLCAQIRALLPRLPLLPRPLVRSAAQIAQCMMAARGAILILLTLPEKPRRGKLVSEASKPKFS